MTRRKLADGSIRDTDWQLEEYRRVAGEEAAERQRLAAASERGACTCHARTLRTKDGYRRVHHPECSKWKPWMEDIRRV